jgi:hypothetical protein
MRHRHAQRPFLVAPLVLLAAAGIASAQRLPAPRINDVLPMGGKAGTTFEVKVTGQNLTGAEGLHFSFRGARIEVLGSESVTDQQPKKKKGNQPATLQAQRFKVTLPPDAPLGIQDVRIVGKGGISNARAFVVGDLAEVNEQEPNDDTDKAQKVPLNCVVNGVIQTPTDVDYYAFTGKAGQRVVCSCLASSIDSKLPAAIEIYDRNGISHGVGRNYAGNDALLDVTLPTDGDYLVRVFGFTYTQGGNDYFYRLQIATTPWIDAVMPPLVEPGKVSEVTVYGRNLPGGVLDPASDFAGRTLEKAKVKVQAPGDAVAIQRLAYAGQVPPIASLLDGFTLRLKNAAGASNPYLLTYAHAPVVLDNGDNDSLDKAQPIAVPCAIAGRIEKKRDADWYRFTAKKAEVLTIEAMADRIGSPADLYFQVVSDKGTVIATQDDTPETMTPYFSARTDDPPSYRFVPPADGTYYLKVSSQAAFVDFGPRHLYTVHIGPPAPDFHVVALPASTLTPDAGLLGKHGSYAFNVFVWRLGGFAGDVTVAGTNLPPGISVQPQILHNGQKQAMLVVRAAGDAPPFAGAITVTATAEIDGKKRTREVRSAGITWPVPQPNILTVTRLDRELVLAVRDEAPYSLAAEKDQISVRQGEKITIPVKLQKHWTDFKSNVQLSAAALPSGLNMPPVSLTAGKDAAVAVFEAKGGKGLAPGQYTLVLRGQTQPIPAKGGAMPKGGPINYVQYTQPVELTVTAKASAK